MALRNLSIGHERLFAANVETSYGVTPPTAPASNGTDCIPLTAMDFGIEIEKFDNEEFNDTRSIIEEMTGKRVGKFSLTKHVKGGGAVNPTVKPDDFELLQCLFSTEVGSGTQDAVGGTPTTTTCDVTTASNFTISQLISFGASTSTTARAAFLTNKVSSTITWTPALSSAPAGSTVINNGFGWLLAANPVQSMCGFARRSRNEVFMLTGMLFNELEFDVKGKGPIMMSYKGFYKDEFQTGADTLGADLASSGAVTVTVTDAYRFSAGSLIKIDSEVLLVASVASATTLSVASGGRAQQGTSAAAHLTGADVLPYMPTPSYNSGAVALTGSKGYVYIGGVAYRIGTGKITLNNNMALWDEEFGTETIELYQTGKIDARFDLELLLLPTTLAQYYNFRAASSKEIFIQIGTTPGQIFAMRMPVCEYKTAVLTDPANNTYGKIRLTGICKGSAGNDNIQVGVA